MSPGQTLRLAANGNYTHGVGVDGFNDLPSGVVGAEVVVDFRWATVTGGARGIHRQNKSYTRFKNVRLRDQTESCIRVLSSDHIYIDNHDLASMVGTLVDVTKNKDSTEVHYSNGLISESTGLDTCDGYEFWNCQDCTVTDCNGSGLRNGASEIDNGHPFEVYGENAGEACTGIVFTRCHAADSRAGFSVESPNDDAEHDVSLVDCTSAGDHDFYDYYCEAPGVMNITGYDAGTLGGDGTINTD